MPDLERRWGRRRVARNTRAWPVSRRGAPCSRIRRAGAHRNKRCLGPTFCTLRKAVCRNCGRRPPQLIGILGGCRGRILILLVAPLPQAGLDLIDEPQVLVKLRRALPPAVHAV